MTSSLVYSFSGSHFKKKLSDTYLYVPNHPTYIKFTQILSEFKKDKCSTLWLRYVKSSRIQATTVLYMFHHANYSYQACYGQNTHVCLNIDFFLLFLFTEQQYTWDARCRMANITKMQKTLNKVICISCFWTASPSISGFALFYIFRHIELNDALITCTCGNIKQMSKGSSVEIRHADKQKQEKAQLVRKGTPR